MLYTILLDTVTKGYHQCQFEVGDGEDFLVFKINRGFGNSCSVCDSRGYVGNLEKKLCDILYQYPAISMSA